MDLSENCYFPLKSKDMEEENVYHELSAVVIDGKGGDEHAPEDEEEYVDMMDNTAP